MEAVGLADVVQNAVVDDQQFLVEVHLPPFVHQVHVDGLAVLHDGGRMAYGACPVDFVEARVEVLQHEGDVRAVVAVELQQRQQDVQQRVGAFAHPASHLRYPAVVDDVALFVRTLEHLHRPVDPHGEFVEEQPLPVVQFRPVGVDDVVGRVFREHPSLFVHQHLGQDEDAVFQRGIVEVTHVAERHQPLDVLQGVYPLQHIAHQSGIILVFLDKNPHPMAFPLTQ